MGLACVRLVPSKVGRDVLPCKACRTSTTMHAGLKRKKDGQSSCICSAHGAPRVSYDMHQYICDRAFRPNSKGVLSGNSDNHTRFRGNNELDARSQEARSANKNGHNALQQGGETTQITCFCPAPCACMDRACMHKCRQCRQQRCKLAKGSCPC
jgi:hypothetical protein